MALAIYNGVAVKLSGENLIRAPSATIEVRREDTGALASIFSDQAGTIAITNPSAFADANGNFSFYAEGLEQGYRVIVTDGAFSLTRRHQAVGTAAEFDATTFIGTLLAAASAAAARVILGLTAIAAKGDTWFGTAANTLATKSAPANGRVRMADSAQTDGWQDVPAAFNWKNRLINPDGAIYQRAVAATADDAYFADRWYILSQTGTVTPSVLTDPEDGYPKGVRITQSQASAQRFGFAQIIEGKNCKDLRGQSGVLVPRIRASASQAIRYAILAWNGVEDAVTSDVVSDWTSASYVSGGFFPGGSPSDISVIAVGSATPSANVWTSLTAISGALGSTFNNIIVLVWTEGTAAQNFTLDFDYVQFERGSVATEFERRSFLAEVDECQRFVEKSYELGTAPGTVTNVGAHARRAITTDDDYWPISFSVLKRGAPSITLYSPDTGASGNWRNVSDSADRAAVVVLTGDHGFAVNISGAGSIGAGELARGHWLAVVEL